jgi:hypothetical protein
MWSYPGYIAFAGWGSLRTDNHAAGQWKRVFTSSVLVFCRVQEAARYGIWNYIFHRTRKRVSIGSPHAQAKDTAQVVEEAVDRMLEYDARFIQAVEEGRAAAKRGDLLEHDEVVERIERIFRS